MLILLLILLHNLFIILSSWQVLRIQQPVSNVTASNKHEQPTKSTAFDIEWSVGDADDWGDSQENSECSWDDNSPYNTPPLNKREASETSRADETRVYNLEHAVDGLSALTLIMSLFLKKLLRNPNFLNKIDNF